MGTATFYLRYRMSVETFWCLDLKHYELFETTVGRRSVIADLKEVIEENQLLRASSLVPRKVS